MKIVYKKTTLKDVENLVKSAQGRIDYIEVSRQELIDIIDDVYLSEVNDRDVLRETYELFTFKKYYIDCVYLPFLGVVLRVIKEDRNET